MEKQIRKHSCPEGLVSPCIRDKSPVQVVIYFTSYWAHEENLTDLMYIESLLSALEHLLDLFIF